MFIQEGRGTKKKVIWKESYTKEGLSYKSRPLSSKLLIISHVHPIYTRTLRTFIINYLQPNSNNTTFILKFLIGKIG